MVNTDVRTLMLFEFNRALSYISEIIEIERKKKQLTKQCNSLECELYDWREEDLTKEEKIVAEEIISDMEIKLQDIRAEMEELENYEEALKRLVTKIMEAVTKKAFVRLEKAEIRQDMLEEYVYLICEIEIEDEKINIDDIFGEVADFVILLAQMYGEDVTSLISDILIDAIGDFDEYLN